MSAVATLERHDIQGGVLRGYGFSFATYLMLSGVDRDWLAGVAGRVTTAEDWSSGKPLVAVNVALTATGLEALGVSLDGFPGAFRAGMAARAGRLGDTGASAPSGWERGLRGVGEGHVLVWVQARGADELRAATDALLDGCSAACVHRQEAEALPFGREHFGFSDGFAQPSVAGSGQPNRPGEGVAGRFGRWRLLRPGEIVLGYEDEDGLRPPAPPPPHDRNATFMVLRKLAQDVAAWRSWLRETADRWAGGDREWLAAKVVGRWTDGTPVAREPGRGPRRQIMDPREMNAFGYASDPAGARCPVGAHIRRANARDGLAGGADRTRRHRMIRRGMPYGPALEGEVDDGLERGLHFACFNADIARQFEVVQGWCVDGNLFGLGPGDRDLLAGGGTGGSLLIPGRPPLRVPGPDRPLVTVRGGEYLYVPSISGLRAIAAGTGA